MCARRVRAANVFCSADGGVKLCDFGLASPLRTDTTDGCHATTLALDSSRPSVAGDDEANALAAGTPLYMSPERRRLSEGRARPSARVHAARGGVGFPSSEGSPPTKVGPFTAVGMVSMPATIGQMADEVEEACTAANGVRAGGAAAAISSVGRASDVYSLGVCAAELHGRFTTAMERAEVLSALKRDAAEAAEAADVEVDDGHGLVRAMLAANPAERPTTAAAERAARAIVVASAA
jgi:serine/threonine protein kinase